MGRLAGVCSLSGGVLTFLFLRIVTVSSTTRLSIRITLCYPLLLTKYGCNQEFSFVRSLVERNRGTADSSISTQFSVFGHRDSRKTLASNHQLSCGNLYVQLSLRTTVITGP
uniref:Putative secreted protein n=1 Tax=Anopheles darlingi TaxID=43151 RepID=A0A2M4DB91_ANODA